MGVAYTGISGLLHNCTLGVQVKVYTDGSLLVAGRDMIILKASHPANTAAHFVVHRHISPKTVRPSCEIDLTYATM